jgi:hypothetical protein
MKQILGGAAAAIALIFLMSLEAPEIKRIWMDLGGRAEFVTSQKYIVLRYKCTNWNLFMWNSCQTEYVEAAKASVTSTDRQYDQAAGTLTDVRFGRASELRPKLLQLRADPTQLTTDLSVDTAVHRAILMGLFLTALLIFLLGAIVAVIAGFRNISTARA